MLTDRKLHAVDRHLTSVCCSCERQAVSFPQARQRYVVLSLITRGPEFDYLVIGVHIEVILAVELTALDVRTLFGLSQLTRHVIPPAQLVGEPATTCVEVGTADD